MSRPKLTEEQKKLKIKEYNKKYRETHKEQRKKYMQKYYETHKAEINALTYEKYIKPFQQQNKEVVNAKNRAWRASKGEEYKTYTREYMRKYRAENRNNINEKEKQYDKLRKQRKERLIMPQESKSYNKIDCHKDICDSIHKLYVAKNHDYGDSVNDTFKKFGMDAFLVRMYDKINRVYSLTRTQAEAKVQDEKIEDTLLDLANYAIIAAMELKQNKIK